MLDSMARIFTLSGLLFLAVAAVFLGLGKDPEHFITVYQAEVAGNYAYSCFCLAFILMLVARWRGQ